MIAEFMAAVGNQLVKGYPPDGRDYWAARFWDRDLAERDLVLGDHYRSQKEVVGDLLEQYAADTDRILEFACGTGEFTALAAARTNAKEIVALDISEQGLRIARGRVDHPGLRLVQGDFWADHQLGTADLVMCLDAIHHLGDVSQVLRRLRSFVKPGGLFLGNLWTADHFHELQRQRYGSIPHTLRMAVFLGTAALVRVSDGKLRTGMYRTQLLRTREIESLLGSVFPQVLAVRPQHHFAAFVCRVPAEG